MVIQQCARLAMLVLCGCLFACQAVPGDAPSQTDAAVPVQAVGGPTIGQRVRQVQEAAPVVLRDFALRAQTRLVQPVLEPARALKFLQAGIASWYGRQFHGRRTANGERYDMYALTAAHRTLPLGTRVRVTNQASGRSVVVRINDRGPFVRGRIIDLSLAAAQELGMSRAGTARVVLEEPLARGTGE